MAYVIFKASRCYQHGRGYSGPTCQTAGVEAGEVYESLEEAKSDAAKLTRCNPVGFTVEPFRTREQYEATREQEDNSDLGI